MKAATTATSAGSQGDQFKLWAEANKIPLHPAVIELCNRLGLEVPWVYRW